MCRTNKSKFHKTPRKNIILASCNYILHNFYHKKISDIFIINKFSNIPLASVNVNFNCGYIVIVYYLLVIIVLNIKSIKLKNEITN